MSIRATAWAWQLGDKVSGTNLLVLLCIADHANQKDECWPFIRRIAERCRIGERAVQKCIRSLEESGLLSRVIREGSSSVFRLSVPENFDADGVNGGSPGGVPSFTGGCPTVHRGVNGGSPMDASKIESNLFGSNELQTPKKEGTVIEPSENQYMSNPADSTLFEVRTPTMEDKRNDAIAEVFACYLNTFGREANLYKLNPSRRAHGIARLKWVQGLCSGDLEAAKEILIARVNAIAASDFHMGRNPSGKKYIDWTDIVMKEKKFEEWFHEQVDKQRGAAR